MPRARRATANRARRQRVAAGGVNPRESQSHTDIRPTHIDSYGYRCVSYAFPI